MHNSVSLSSDARGPNQILACIKDDLLRDDPPIFHPCEMPHPCDTPLQIYLYADFRPSAHETPIYLCNPTRNAIYDVRVLSEWISMHQFYHVDASDRWSDPLGRDAQHLDSLGAGRAILIGILDHEIWDIVSRYRLGFRGVSGDVAWMSACDLELNACRQGQADSRPWVEFHSDTAAAFE